MTESEACRSDLEGRGVGDAYRRWLSRLVTTRGVFIVPNTNAPGYDRKSWTEDSIHLNRYFPKNLADQSDSMYA